MYRSEIYADFERLCLTKASTSAIRRLILLKTQGMNPVTDFVNYDGTVLGVDDVCQKTSKYVKAKTWFKEKDLDVFARKMHKHEASMRLRTENILTYAESRELFALHGRFRSDVVAFRRALISSTQVEVCGIHFFDWCGDLRSADDIAKAVTMYSCDPYDMVDTLVAGLGVGALATAGYYLFKRRPLRITTLKDFDEFMHANKQAIRKCVEEQPAKDKKKRRAAFAHEKSLCSMSAMERCLWELNVWVAKEIKEEAHQRFVRKFCPLMRGKILSMKKLLGFGKKKEEEAAKSTFRFGFGGSWIKIDSTQALRAFLSEHREEIRNKLREMITGRLMFRRIDPCAIMISVLSAYRRQLGPNVDMAAACAIFKLKFPGFFTRMSRK